MSDEINIESRPEGAVGRIYCSPQIDSGLTSLRAERDALKLKAERLVKALRPFAEALHKLEHELQFTVPEISDLLTGTWIGESDLREADAAIKEAGKL